MDAFTEIYDANGNEVNWIPVNTPCYVWCSNGSDEEGFAEVECSDELGLNALIAKSWITEEHLLRLRETKYPTN